MGQLGRGDHGGRGCRNGIPSASAFRARPYRDGSRGSAGGYLDSGSGMITLQEVAYIFIGVVMIRALFWLYENAKKGE